MEKKELTTEEWRAEKKKKKAQMAAMQALPYEVKLKRAELRAHEFIRELDTRGLAAHVSVGGLDSIVLLLFLRSIGIDVPAISVSSLEDKSIQRVHKALGVETIKPGRPHRFDQLRQRNPKEWEFWMYRCCTDQKTGEKFGWGRVLDYIGVGWEDVPDAIDIRGQMEIERDFPEIVPGS